jgi:integrase
MGTVYLKGKMLWIGFKRGDEWVYQSSGLGVGHEAKARKLLEKIEAKIEAGEELEKASGVDVHVLAHYADVWIEKREALGLADWKSDRARLRDHVLPVLGEKRLDEVRPRHLKDLFLKLRTAGKLAPKTIHHVYTVTKALFRDAVLDELVETSPCILGKYELGKVQDKDPEWRSTAVYTRAELEALIADERIPYDRRVLYALEGLAGLRHGEAAGLRWRHVDLALEPLGCLLIATSYDKGRTKTGAPRRVPIHPTLAAILAEWKLSGWPAMMQRNAGADDIVVPLPLHEGQVGGTPNPRAGKMRNKSDSWKRLAKDFATLELRPGEATTCGGRSSPWRGRTARAATSSRS